MFEEKIDIVPDLIATNIIRSKEFKEFGENLDELCIIIDPELYMEAVVDRNNTLKNTARAIKRNTINSTRQVTSIYGDITDAGGGVIKSTWDLIMNCVHLCSKTLIFTLNKIEILPRLITNTVIKISNIPDDIKNKIKGNIKLYITVDDIYALYNQNIFRLLDQFLADSDIIIKGDTWGTFLHRRNDKNGTNILQRGSNDISIMKKMQKVYSKLKLIEFSQTTIEMSNTNNLSIYFGDNKSVKFVDLSGKKHECTYYEALEQLLKDLQSEKSRLEHLQGEIGNKYDESRMNQNFGSLPPDAQKRITDTIVMISKVISIIGNIIRYVTKDINELSTAADKILKSRKIK